MNNKKFIDRSHHFITLSYAASRVVIQHYYFVPREDIERSSSHQEEIGMSYAEMTEITTGVRELTDAELAMVAGGGVYGDLAKLAGGALGKVVGDAIGLGGTLGGALVAGMVILGQAAYNSYSPSNELPSTPMRTPRSDPSK